MTVNQLLNQADSHELTEWQSFFYVESGEYGKNKQKPLDKMRAMFADRIVRDGDDR